MLNSRISAWEFFQSPFDFNKMPLGLVGCRVLIHAKPSTCQSWVYWAKNGFYIGPALDSYRCFKLVNADTKSQLFLDTVEFCHGYLPVPSPSTEDRIIHGLQVVAGALSGVALPMSISQVNAIANLWDIFKSWHLLAPLTLHPSRNLTPGLPRVHSQDAPRMAIMQLPTPTPTLSPSPAWISPPRPNSSLRLPLPAPLTGHATPRQLNFSDMPAPPAPRVLSEPRQPNVRPPHLPPLSLPVCKPIAHCTRSWALAPLALFLAGRLYYEQVKYHIPTAKALRTSEKPLAFTGLCEAFDMKPAEVEGFAYLYKALTLEDGPELSALSILDPATGKFLEHRQLRQDPRYKATWDTLYANELGRLCQGIGAGNTSTAQCVNGTNTFFLINYQDIPAHKKKEICHTMVVCEVRPEKDNPNRTRITIGGNCICYPGNVGTNTASLKLVKLLLNSVLSWKGARFSSINLKNFYFDIPMPDPEYVQIKIADIPEEFIKEYNLAGQDRDGWIYFKIRQGCYGLPQAGILANDLLQTRLVAEDYYKAASTPGLWHHK
jgi:hypothetical protein